MKTAEEIKDKITELEEAVEEINEELEEALEEAETDEVSDKGVRIAAEFEMKREMIEKQIKLLQWIIE